MSSSTPLVAIVGRPNVGKSTLFNRLVGRRQAITDDREGTTRDANYAPVDWRGKRFTLVDTAGLSRAEGEIELQVREQIDNIAEAAAVIIVMVDAATMITAEDQAAARLALKAGKPVILALGKIDTTGSTLELETWRKLGIAELAPVSGIHGRGTGDLLDSIINLLPQAPAITDDNEPLRLALIGRPNVGKSSLLNSLVGKQAAVVSSIPGTTRDVTSARLTYHGRTIELLDTAGVRRRGHIEPGVEKFSSLRTLTTISQADVCVLVMDATEGATHADLTLAGRILEAGRGLILVMNKWDAVEKDEHTQDHMTATLRRQFQFAWWAPLVYTSATEGRHVTKLFELAFSIADHRATTVTTPALNQLLERLTLAHPPAGLKNRRPKINYVTQTGTNPPTFTFFATYADLIHFGYRRYLENNMREQWDFTGTPINLEFRAKHKPHER